MQLQTIDWAIVIGLLITVLAIGAIVARRSGQNAAQFFLSGRGMPWWLLGFSMVATTFATDTPNLVTGIVRERGVSGNWLWWAFLLTGMLTVFIYARLWRRSGVLTDLEFYEIRYGGRLAAFLRGFRAVYLGVIFNVIVMANVSLAAIKIGQVLLQLGPHETILAASVVTVVFSSLGGLRGVVFTDAILFVIAMVGAVAAAVVAVNLPEVGGLRQLFTHDAVAERLALVPSFDLNDAATTETFVAIFLVPLAVQWWSVWYPGSEPGGGGYLAQRMLAARNEKHATAAVLFFNVAHYAIRPWPWILVALASVVVFPQLDDLRQAFPHVDENIMRNDLAYPAMLTFLPPGWMGLVVASLLAAYISTISTQLNWGASYVVNDVYKRFVNPDASDRQQVRMGRITTVMLMVISGYVALQLESAMQSFNILLQIGAGTGLLFILRWFWWRINAASEITAMVLSFLVAVTFQFAWPDHGLPAWAVLCLGVLITTVGWLIVALVTPAEDEQTLVSFCRLVRPAGPGWRRFYARAAEAGEPIPAPDPDDNLSLGVLRMLIGSISVYATLFATGYWLYGRTTAAIVFTVVACVALMLLVGTYRRRRIGTE